MSPHFSITLPPGDAVVSRRTCCRAPSATTTTPVLFAARYENNKGGRSTRAATFSTKQILGSQTYEQLRGEEDESRTASTAANDEEEEYNATPSLASVIADGNYARSGAGAAAAAHTTSTRAAKPRYSIYDMDASAIGQISYIDDLEDLVMQVEAMADFEAGDVGPLLLPLTRLTSMKKYGRRGAVMTEKLLFTCLARLPAELSDRYNNNSMDSSFPYPTTSMYNRAMIAWGNLGSLEGAERAESIFQLQMQEYTREFEFLRNLRQHGFAGDGKTEAAPFLPLEPFARPPDRRCHKSRIRAWALCKDPVAPARSYQLLQEMEALAGIPELIRQYRKQRLDEAFEKSPKSLPHEVGGSQQQQQLSQTQIELPDLATYNVVMGAYARSFVDRFPVALNRVKSMIQHLDDLHAATGDDEYVLDGHSYIVILQTYQRWIAHHPPPLHPTLAHEIIALLERLHQRIALERPNDDSGAAPNTDWEALEDEMITSGRKSLDGNYVRERQIEPDRSFLFPLSMGFAYGVLIEALVKTPPLHATIELADDILLALSGKVNRINDGNSKTDSPLSIPYDICEKSWPSNEVIVQVTEAWERSGMPDADMRIQRILHLFVVERPYGRTFELNDAMNQWSMSGWKLAPFLLESMLIRALERTNHKGNKPTGESFAIVMLSWLRSKRDDAPYRIELLLQHMRQLYEEKRDSWYKPQEVHLRYLMFAWVNRCSSGKRFDGMSGSDMYPAEHCESLILLFQGKPWFDENFTSQFALAIRAWATQRLPSPAEEEEEPPNPVQRAMKLLDTLAETRPADTKLPAFPCNWVLTACCQKQPTEERRREAFHTAIAVVNRAIHNARTFVLAAKVLREQVPELQAEHLSTIEDLFRKASSCGMLTQELITEVVEVARPETLQKLFGISYQYAGLIVAERSKPAGESTLYSRTPNALLIENLPQEWSVHANTQRKRKANEPPRR